jgi:hypothetical protein
MPRNTSQHLDYGWLRVARSIWITAAILEVHADSIVLIRERLLRQRRYVLPRSSITRLSEEQLFWFLFSGALRIEHTVASYPTFVFWSRDIEVLTVQLRQLGFPVCTSNA